MLPIPYQALLVEISLVERAVAAYPRNYHAWNYRFICLRRAIYAASAEAGTDDGPAFGSENSTVNAVNAMSKRQLSQWHILIQDEYAKMNNWTDTHVSDSTSMQYLAQVIHVHLQLNLPLSLPPTTTPSGCAGQDREEFIFAPNPPPAMSHVLSLLRSYPSHEAIWTYLRQVCALLASDNDAERTDLMHNIFAWLPDDDRNVPEIDQHGGSSPILEERVSEGGEISSTATITLASDLTNRKETQMRLFQKRFVDYIVYLGRKREGI